MDNNPVNICWMCETEGWAYDNIATRFIERLPSFRHIKIFVNETNSREIINKICRESDIVVVFFPCHLKLLDEKFNNVLLRLDGNRALEHENNIIGRKHEKMELGSNNVRPDESLST